MEEGKEFLEKLEENIGHIEQSTGSDIVVNSKMVGTYVDTEDNTVEKSPLFDTADEAFAEYETRAARLGLPASDDSEEMDDIVSEKMLDEWIDKILELM